MSEWQQGPPSVRGLATIRGDGDDAEILDERGCCRVNCPTHALLFPPDAGATNIQVVTTQERHRKASLGDGFQKSVAGAMETICGTKKCVILPPL